jgi:hypothetical protein
MMPTHDRKQIQRADQARGHDSQGGSSQSSMSTFSIKRRHFYFDDNALASDKREEAIKNLMLLGGV